MANLAEKQIVNFVVTLKSGGDFEEFDAITLCRQVKKHLLIPHRFICYTDLEIDYPYMETIKLQKNLPGWWSMIEMFRTKGPTIASGLDMLVVDNIDRLGEIALTCPEDVFYMAEPQALAKNRGEKFCSGLQIWNGNWTWLFKMFKEEDFKYKMEQRYTYNKLEERRFKIKTVQSVFDGYYSFKHHCKFGRKPKDARVILFHGKPRIKECGVGWVQKIYRETEEPPHPFEIMAKEQEDVRSDEEIL